MVQPRLLIVEDDNTWLDFLVRRLQSTEYMIESTRKTSEAVNLILVNNYVLVLLDWNMPGIGGHGVMKAIQDVEFKPPIVILSGYGNPEQRSNAFQLGARAFLDKPQNKKQWDELKRTISEFIKDPSLK